MTVLFFSFFFFFFVFLDYSTGHKQTKLNQICYFLCGAEAVKRLSVHHYGADYIFWSFGITGFILSYSDNKSSVLDNARGHGQNCTFHYWS